MSISVSLSIHLSIYIRERGKEGERAFTTVYLLPEKNWNVHHQEMVSQIMTDLPSAVLCRRRPLKHLVGYKIKQRMLKTKQDKKQLHMCKFNLYMFMQHKEYVESYCSFGETRGR